MATYVQSVNYAQSATECHVLAGQTWVTIIKSVDAIILAIKEHSGARLKLRVNNNDANEIASMMENPPRGCRYICCADGNFWITKPNIPPSPDSIVVGIALIVPPIDQARVVLEREHVEKIVPAIRSLTGRISSNLNKAVRTRTDQNLGSVFS